MPNWKKVITSGSTAVLNEITSSGGIYSAGNIQSRESILGRDTYLQRLVTLVTRPELDSTANTSIDFLTRNSTSGQIERHSLGSNAFNSTTIPSAANNATITISAGNALTGGAAFTTNQSSNETITINHGDTSSQSSVNGSGRTYIQDITLDTYGHVTGIGTATETVTNTDTIDMGDGFLVEDGNSPPTKVQITENKMLKFINGTGIDIRFTDSNNGSSSDPFDLTVSLASGGVGAGTYGSTNDNTKIDQITVDAYGRVTNVTTGATGDITGVTAGTGLSGGSTSGTATLNSVYLPAVDDRDMKPNTSGVGSTVKGIKPFFTSLGGMTGTADTDYQDALVLDTYSDSSGGNANCLIFDKSTFLIKHYNAVSTATSWGTPKTIAYTSDIPSAANNATITISAGNGLTTGGNFTTNQSSNETITIHHADTSTQASVNNSGNTVIQDVTLDGYGHVTGLTSKSLIIPTVNNATLTLNTSAGLNGSTTFTANQSSATTFNVSLDLSELTDKTDAIDASVDEIIMLDNGAERRKRFSEIFGSNAYNSTTIPSAANNATITISAGNGLTGGAAFTTNQGISETITINHADTSTQASVNNSGRTYIQDITLDTYGHITGITSATETVVNTNTTYSTNATFGTANSGTEIRLHGDSLGSGVNLDEMRKQGVFSQNSNSNAAAGSNYPEDLAGILVVNDDMYGNGLHTHQMYAIYNSVNIYSRSYYNGSWTKWRNLAADTDTTYSADGNYGMTLSGTKFRLENDRRRNSTSTDIYTGNTHDFTWYDASVGIIWYAAGSEKMRLLDNGTLHVKGDVIAFSSSTISDKRLKDNIKTIENPLDKIKALRGVEYDWNNGNRKGKHDLGLIAQEVESVIPDIVHEHTLPYVEGEEDTLYKTVDYEKMVAVLIEGMKEQQSQIEELKSEMKKLKGEI